MATISSRNASSLNGGGQCAEKQAIFGGESSEIIEGSATLLDGPVEKATKTNNYAAEKSSAIDVKAEAEQTQREEGAVAVAEPGMFALTRREELNLEHSVSKMLQDGKGILAADDSLESLGARLIACGMESSADNRRLYRQMLFTTPNISKHISAVILHDETFRQCTDKGDRLVDLLRRQGIVVGVKIDADPVPFIPQPNGQNCMGETITQGLDNLMERAAEYKKGGCTFAKWRCAYRISEKMPSKLALEQNAMVMARYAMICQRNGLVPIVEPDVSCEGGHSIGQCQKATERVLAHIFKALADHAIFLEDAIFRREMNMVTSGLGANVQAVPEEVAQQTLLTLSRTIPAAVPGIAFLSGGQNELVATQNLCAINKFAGQTGSNKKPWQLTFCYGRALQANVMEIWRGIGENVSAAQKQFLHRARANANAEQVIYESEKAVSMALSEMDFFGTVNTRYY